MGTLASIASLWRRDLVRILRKRRSGLLLGGYTVVLAGLIFVTWPPRHTTPFEMQMQSERFLYVFTCLSFVWMAIALPAYGATSLTQEHERDTYEMLSLTLIPHWGVVLGKCGAHLGTFVGVMIASIPVLSTAFFLVGLEWYTFVFLFGLIVASGIACVTIGVACSTLVKSSRAAVLFSYLGVAVLFGLPLVLWAAVMEGMFGFSIDTEFERILQIYSPIGTAFGILGLGLDLEGYLEALRYIALFSLAAFSVAWFRLAYPGIGLRRRNRRIPFDQESEPIAQTAARGRCVEFGDRGNPWYFREARFGALTRSRARGWMYLWSTLLLSALAFALLGFFYGDSGMTGDDILQTWVGVQMIAVAVVSPVITANTFTREIDGDRMDVLRGTLLPASKYVLGTLRAGLRAIAPILQMCAVTTLILYPAIAETDNPAIAYAKAYALLIGTAVVASAIGVLAGASTKSTTLALVMALAGSFAILLGFYLFLDVGTSILRNLLFRSSIAYDNRIENTAAYRSILYFVRDMSPALALFQDYTFEKESQEFSRYWFGAIARTALLAGMIVLLSMVQFKRKMLREN